MSGVECLRVEAHRGQEALILLKALGLHNPHFKVGREGSFLLLPLKSPLEETAREALSAKLGPFDVNVKPLQPKPHPPSYLELLKERLPTPLLASAPRSFDVVGSVAVVEIPPELKGYGGVVGGAILEAHSRVKTVLARRGSVAGEYRLRDLELIEGVEETETLHTEYNCRLLLDVRKVYFSPRLGYEHSRVAGLVEEGERVVDMFAGVGPFTIQIARRLRDVTVYAVDKNPEAFSYLKRNIALNHVEEKVVPLLGDAETVIREKLGGVGDRVIMNLPEKAPALFNSALAALKPGGGVVHLYRFTSQPEAGEVLLRDLGEVAEGMSRRVAGGVRPRIVREVAPRRWQVVLDLPIR